MVRSVLACAAITVITASTGCVAIAAAGAGVGTYAYVSGDLEKHIEAPLDRVYDAALAEMEEMEKVWREQNAKIMADHPQGGAHEMEPTGAWPAVTQPRPPAAETPPAEPATEQPAAEEPKAS